MLAGGRNLDPPAIVAGVHITRLTPDGGKVPIDPAKITLGPMSGLPIVLAPVNDGLGLAITEGIEDGLSVFEETGLGVWAAGSAGNMPKIVAALPPYVESTTIFAHRDEKGMQFALCLRDLYVAVLVMFTRRCSKSSHKNRALTDSTHAESTLHMGFSRRA